MMRPDYSIRRRWAATAVAASVVLLSGCETPGKNPFAWTKTKSKQAAAGSSNAGATGEDAASASTLSRMTNTENGLAIRKWIVADDEQRISAVLMQHAIGGVLGDDANHRLQRNGFRLIRVPAEDLNDILTQLGGATLDVTAWHGQVYDWRAIAAHGIGAAGQPLAIDGHVQMYRAGEMRLVLRSWIVAMENGPFVQLEMVPQFYLPQKRDLTALLGREKSQPVESFSSMAIDYLLEADAAYVLTCAPPQSQWNIGAAGPDSAKAAPPSTPAPPTTRRSGGGVGPMDVVGPEAPVPQTIGQWMFSNDIGRPSRIMLVLLPRISDRLYPPDVASASAAPRSDGP